MHTTIQTLLIMTRSQRINRIIYEGDRYDLSAVAAGWILDRVMKKRLRTELITRLIRAVLILALVILAVVMGACGESKDYSTRTIEQFNELPPPVILFAKECNWLGCSVTVIDAYGKMTYFGNVSSFAGQLGQSYNIGDTLKRNCKNPIHK